VRDVVDANILAAESDATGVFNIGTGKRISINDLAVIIMGLAGSRLTPVYEAERSGDIRHSLADISKASAIGYRPKYFLQDGIKETLKYISNADEQRFSR
jgi:UDP-glucose 4-epimerase